jgi:hypothetical protein
MRDLAGGSNLAVTTQESGADAAPSLSTALTRTTLRPVSGQATCRETETKDHHPTIASETSRIFSLMRRNASTISGSKCFPFSCEMTSHASSCEIPFL